MTDKPIQVTCEIANVELSAKQAELVKIALAKVIGEVYPGRRLQGLWVHKAVPRGS